MSILGNFLVSVVVFIYLGLQQNTQDGVAYKEKRFIQLTVLDTRTFASLQLHLPKAILPSSMVNGLPLGVYAPECYACVYEGKVGTKKLIKAVQLFVSLCLQSKDVLCTEQSCLSAESIMTCFRKSGKLCPALGKRARDQTLLPLFSLMHSVTFGDSVSQNTNRHYSPESCFCFGKQILLSFVFLKNYFCQQGIGLLLPLFSYEVL